MEAGKFDGFISGGTGGALAPFAKTAQAASKAGGLVDDAARLTNGQLDDAAKLTDDVPTGGGTKPLPGGKAAPNSIELRPYGGPGGGHHTPAKKAFEGALGYDAKKALAIPNEVMKSLGIEHSAVTGAQKSLYAALAKTGQTLTWEAMEAIETKALIRGGADADQALATVRKAIQALKDAGVTAPTRIPWGA